ncbi:MAG TPA: ABC transporter ATP-binding protein [Gemmatimonadaceae bacterium]|nr:ABC transporter ATP-binding protein [Gemmatimonadaceae bacterium]
MRALWQLLPFYRPYRGRFAAGLVLVIVSSGLAGVIPWLLRRAIDGMREGGPSERILLLAAGMVAVALASGAARYGMRDLLNSVSRGIEYDLRNSLFRHLSSLDASFFASMRTGDIMARLTNDLSAVRMAVGPAIMYLVNTIAGGAFALVFMLSIDPWFTLVALLPVALLPVIMAKGGSAIHHRFEAVQEHFSTMTTRAQENISGARIVRAYRQEAPEIERWREMNEEYVRRNMRLVRLWGLLNPGFSLLAGLGGVIVLGYGGRLVLAGQISVGSLVAFGFYLGMLTWPLIALGWVTNLFQRGAASMARLNQILHAHSRVEQTTEPRTLPPAPAGRAIEFRNVGFHYPVREGETPRWVLRHISFALPAGGTLGIVGPTGSGKSALIDLIPRLHDPQEGEIFIDGVSIRDLSLKALRAEIGYVPQETFLFSDTIRANLAYGTDEPSSTAWAAGVAQLGETIAEFPSGYETLLGERGINLSGGQKQRAALARALARRPGIVLLDDALSAVDSHTEAEILHGLRDALGGRTAIIASHRISAIREASWIVVLDGGRIVEEGRHAELFAAGGRYWSLLNRQLLEDSIEHERDVMAPPALSP